MKKRVSIIILVVLTLALVAIMASCGASGQDARKITEAIKSATKRLDNYHQTKAAFADTVMYYLPDSCVYDIEGGFLIYYNENSYIYNKKLKKSKKEHTFYSDIESAVAGENSPEQEVYTLGYRKPFDGGCSRYEVKAEATSEIAEKSGDVYLNYASATKKVNLKQMGWNGDDLWGYQKRFENFSDISTLVFPAGEYPLFDSVRTDRDNVNYYGIEATIYPAKNFGGEINKVYNALWSARKSWSSKKFVTEQTYSGLNFVMRNRDYNPQIEDLKGLFYLMQIAYCKDIKFYNCSYILPEGSFGTDPKKYSSNCFDCFSAWHGVTFDGCAFENRAYTNEGGAIAFRDVYNAGCDDLVFTNNTVVTSTRDEGVALFAGWDKRFHLDNPVLGDGYIRNCLLKNNKFVALEQAEGLEPRTMFLTVGYQLSPVYDIKYIDNTFEGYCNTFFLHYCYCYGLTFKGNTVDLRQTGTGKKLSLVYHNDSPEAKDILVDDNVFNLHGENYDLNCVTITSPYSDASELTFRNNTVNLTEGYAEKIIAGNATVKNNTFNLSRAGSIYFRTYGDVSGNTYNIKKLEKSVLEFYNADVKHDLVLKDEIINVDVALSNLLMFNGTTIKFNDHSILCEKVQFNVKKVDRENYHLCWSSDGITDTTVPITFKKCTFGAYDGHLKIPNGKKHILTIED